MDLVNFMPRNPIRENVKRNIKMCLVNAASYHEESIKNNKFLKHAEWDKVNQQIGLVESIQSILAEGKQETAGERKVELQNFNATGENLQEPMLGGDQTQGDVLGIF
jgi:tRNA G37 N-methylase TrmD